MKKEKRNQKFNKCWTNIKKYCKNCKKRIPIEKLSKKKGKQTCCSPICSAKFRTAKHYQCKKGYKICSKCFKPQKLDFFFKCSRLYDKKLAICKKCCLLDVSRLRKNWTRSQKIRQKARNYRNNLKYRLKNRDKINAFCRLAWKNNRDGIRTKKKRRRQQYSKYYRMRLKQQRRAKKILVINVYGGECACCKERNLEFLTIDHIHNNGAEHRKAVHYGSLADFLIKNNFPLGYRVLCMNCNFSKGQWGYCPHKRKAILWDKIKNRAYQILSGIKMTRKIKEAIKSL